ALPCLALPCLALPCLALPCLALPCLALPCLALPCLSVKNYDKTRHVLDKLSRLIQPQPDIRGANTMQTVQVGEFKARFSEIIDAVRAGETVVVSYGRGHENVAALIPYNQLPASEPRALGILSGQASVAFAPDFEMTDEEFLRA
ncbi:MAG: type II toxin-antitoxin system Phd/YefM family antitoxin, partial [Pseudomonadota bacterium]|nr:type II toxin-antitoxin system Phd/YefM family antitoxin [Pseudomonadota bacterium]